MAGTGAVHFSKGSPQSSGGGSSAGANAPYPRVLRGVLGGPGTLQPRALSLKEELCRRDSPWAPSHRRGGGRGCTGGLGRGGFGARAGWQQSPISHSEWSKCVERPVTTTLSVLQLSNHHLRDVKLCLSEFSPFEPSAPPPHPPWEGCE